MAPRGAGPLTWIRYGIAVASVGLLPAAAVVTPAVATSDRQPEPVLAPEFYEPPENPKDLLWLDKTTVDFFTSRVRIRGETDEVLRQIIDAIILADGLHFAYDAEATFAANDTFRQRRGNCVSFSFLIVAVCRQLGLDASFQDIETAARWDRFGNLVVSVRHLNVRVAGDGYDCIVDLRPDLVPASNLDSLQTETDQRAFAQFYNNVGFFRLLHGRSAEALRYLILATSIDPRFAGAWSNRAQVHARLGDLSAARECFERALREEPRGLVAIDGLVNVLRQLGTPDDLQQADKLSRRARTLQDRNPYYQQFLAARAQDKGDWEAADKLLRRAIALKDDEPEFYEQRIAVLQHLGRANDAERTAAKLTSLRKRLANATPYLTR